MTMSRLTTVSNPFVGPRPISRGEPLYGRTTDSLNLFNQLIPDRIVLMYAPSGAGKTSLLQTKLTELMEDEGFYVWDPIRLSLQASEIEDRSGPRNRYAYSAILSLESHLDEDRRRDESEVRGLTLEDYVNDRLDSDGLDVIFIDQFEELITIDPFDHRAKRSFLEDLSRVLRPKNRWAVFAMREENLAAIDPFRAYLPTELRSSFRLDLLDRAGASEAISYPARDAGRPFADKSLDHLLDKLSQIGGPGTSGDATSNYIEPVHLQVVCQQLWDATEGHRKIREKDVDSIDVPAALQSYVTKTIEIVAEENEVSEKPIRVWLGDQLIRDGVRHQVQTGPEGCPADVIDDLIDRHLIVRVTRRDSSWYELSHDRLITPTERSNERWLETEATALFQRARKWQESDKDDKFLLKSGYEISTLGPTADSDIEREFVVRSRQKRRTRLIVGGTIALLVAVVLGSAIYSYFSTQSSNRELAALNADLQETQDELTANNRTLEETNIQLEETNQELEEANVQLDRALAEAEAQRLVASAGRALGTDSNLSLHLGLLALDAAEGTSAHLDANSVLYEALNTTHVRQSLSREPAASIARTDDHYLVGNLDGSIDIEEIDGPGSTSTSPASTRAVAIFSTEEGLIAVHRSGEIQTWTLTAQQGISTYIGAQAISAAADGEGSMLAIVTNEGSIVLSEVNSDTPAATIIPDTAAVAVDFSPDDSTLYGSDSAGRVYAWDVSTRELIWGPEAEEAATNNEVEGRQALGLAVNPDSLTIAAGAADGAIRIWNASTGTEIQELLSHPMPITAITYSTDGSILWAGSRDGSLTRWTPEAGVTDETPPVRVVGSTGAVLGLLPLDPDRRLLVATESGGPSIWDAGPVVESAVRAIAFNGDDLIGAGHLDGTVSLWDLESDTMTHWPGHERGVYDVAFTPDGSQLVTTSIDGSVRFWDRSTGNQPGGVLPSTGPPEVSVGSEGGFGVDISPDGSRVATASSDGLVGLWSPTGQELDSLEGHSSAVNVVRFSPDGTLLASAGDDGTVRLWSAAGEPVSTLEGHQDSIIALEFSPDGSRFASAGFDETVRVWNTNSATQELVISDPFFDTVYELAWSPDGAQLAVASFDPSTAVQVLDLTSPQGRPSVIMPFPEPALSVTYLNSSELAIAGIGGDVVVRTIDEDRLAALAEERIGRDLTSEECRRFLDDECPTG